jgi:hypothetical protein
MYMSYVHRKRLMNVVSSVFWGAVLMSLAAVAAAQVAAPKPPDIRPPTPRLADGTPNLGRIELSRGYWAPKQYQDYNAILTAPKEIPYRPWAAQLREERHATNSRDDPNGNCLPPAGPRMMTTPYPMEIVQLPEQQRIFMVFEGGAHIWREIYMDGRAFPDDINPTWTGYSIGHWEGDTLVVEVRGFNEKTWLEMYGAPHTDELTVTERFSRPDLYTLHYEGTIIDPGAYTEPWTVAMDIIWDPDGELEEYICQENNRWTGSQQ